MANWMEWLLWSAAIAGLASAAWGALYLKAHRATWILNDLTVVGFALFLLFKSSLSDAAISVAAGALVLWAIALMIVNCRTRASVRREIGGADSAGHLA